MIQEVWGVDGHIADVADRFANAGYVALAPDLYSAGGGRPPTLASERVAAAKAFLNTIPTGAWMAVLGDEQRRAEALSQLPAGEAQEVGETIAALFGGVGGDPTRHLGVLRAAVAFLHARSGVCGPGGWLGRLLPGRWPLRAAGRRGAGARRGGDLLRLLAECRAGRLDPLPACVASMAMTTPASSAACRLSTPRSARAGVDYELRIYPDTPHAFFNDTRPSYRPEAARDAWGRTLAFFADALGSVATVPVHEAAPAS